MKIFVKAKPGTKENKVKKTDEKHFVVSVTKSPVSGRANHAIEKLLALYFNVSKSRVRILSGHTSKDKIIEIV